MVLMFHSYVSLPEGTIQYQSAINHGKKWKIMEKSWKIRENHGKSWNILPFGRGKSEIIDAKYQFLRSI